MRLVTEQVRGHAFILMSVSGEIVWWSPAAETIFGRASNETAGSTIENIFTPEDQRYGIAALELKIADSDATSEDDRWHLRADGSRFWSSGTMSAVKDNNGVLLGFCKILRDRTSLKEQVEHLTAELAAAKQAEAARTVAVATLTHELRNLVAAVFHGGRMLRATEDPERRTHLLDLLDEQAVGVKRLTDDMFDASRVGLARLSVDGKPLDLVEIVTDVVDTWQSRYQQKGVGLDLLSPSAPLNVLGDASRLNQVVSNLLDNAIKFTEPGGRVWVKLTVEDAEAIVHVEDTGAGIAAHMLSPIFDLFTQANSPGAGEDSKTDSSATNANGQHGLGVGLAVVKQIVALHGGSVQACSGGKGRGSQFTVRLPLLNVSM